MTALPADQPRDYLPPCCPRPYNPNSYTNGVENCFMPIYEYECQKCKSHTEAFQKVNDKPLTKCKKCGGRLEKRSRGLQFSSRVPVGTSPTMPQRQRRVIRRNPSQRLRKRPRRNPKRAPQLRNRPTRLHLPKLQAIEVVPRRQQWVR